MCRFLVGEGQAEWRKKCKLRKVYDILCRARKSDRHNFFTIWKLNQSCLQEWSPFLESWFNFPCVSILVSFLWSEEENGSGSWHSAKSTEVRSAWFFRHPKAEWKSSIWRKSFFDFLVLLSRYRHLSVVFGSQMWRNGENRPMYCTLSGKHEIWNKLNFVSFCSWINFVHHNVPLFLNFILVCAQDGKLGRIDIMKIGHFQLPRQIVAT